MYIIIADDQYDVREALKCLLEHEADLQLASEASNAAELLARLKQGCPDLVLLDWELAGMGGHDLITSMRACCPLVKVIALSVRPEAREEALHEKVQEFVSKGDPPECVLAAVRRIESWI